MSPRAALPIVLAAMVALGACADAPLPVSGERALGRVRHQVDAGPRIPGTPGHAAIQRWIADEMTRLGGQVESQAAVDTLQGRPLPFTNLIAHFGPGGGRRIALLAHWDTRPFSDQDADSSHRQDPVPGANDGASGVAVLMEVAELMHQRTPAIGVDLVFLDAEDQGRASEPNEFCIGARAYARRIAALSGPQRPVAAFLFDMVGDRDLGIWPEVNSQRHAANLEAIVLEAARHTGASHFHSMPRYTLTDDHIPLLDAGIAAVDVIDFDYPAWHTHLDLPDQVSAASLEEVSKVAAWIVYRSAFSTSR